MIKRVFVDTSAWYALADTGDERHKSAVRILEHQLRDETFLVTTNHVVSESYTLLRIRLGGVAAREFLHRVRGSARTERIFVVQEWEEAAEDLLAQSQDQDFSSVDATSFITMRRMHIEHAFAFDQHFHSAGFALLIVP